MTQHLPVACESKKVTSAIMLEETPCSEALRQHQAAVLPTCVLSMVCKEAVKDQVWGVFMSCAQLISWMQLPLGLFSVLTFCNPASSTLTCWDSSCSLRIVVQTAMTMSRERHHLDSVAE